MDTFRDNYQLETWRNRDTDGKKTPHRIDNSYVKTIGQEEAMEFFEKAGPTGSKYNTLKTELDLAYEDLRTEQMTMQKLREDEAQILEDQAVVTALEKKKSDSPLAITSEESEVLRSMNSAQLAAAYEAARDERIRVDGRRETFSKKIARLTKELEECRAKTNSTQVWCENGVYKKKWVHASDESSALQSHKRTRVEIGREFASMLVTADGLLAIDYEKSLAKIKEYRGIFDSGSQDYDLLNSIVEEIEEGKEHISRESFSMVCYESLSEANQRKYTHVVEKLIKPNKKKKYEFQLPALYSARVTQVKADGKNNPNKTAFKGNLGQGKSRGAPNRFTKPFRKTAGSWNGNTWNGAVNRQSFQNRFNTSRPRGTFSPRGQFRGSFRGQTRGMPRPWNNRGTWAPRGSFRPFQRPRGAWNGGVRNMANTKAER